jgi:molybdopterin molybdotransferase
MTFKEITGLMERNVRPVSSEPVTVIDAPGRISFKDIFSRKDMPPFAVSGLDGYALCGTGDNFRVIGTLEPLSRARQLKNGEALFISTGAPFPDGTRFIAREHVVETGKMIFAHGRGDERRIIEKGDWLKKGERLMERGKAVTPSAMASLALAGYTTLKVYRKPRVAIMVTGSELKKGRLIHSNSFLLAGLIVGDGGEVTSVDVSGDSIEEIERKIRKAEELADLLVLTGGTSQGKKDVTKEALRRAGSRFYIDSPPLMPGKSMAFGKKGGMQFVVLPGNPQSLQTLYRLFVKRILLIMSGKTGTPATEYSLPLPRELKKQHDMVVAVPALVEFLATRIEKLYPNEANAFVIVEKGPDHVPEGESVKVIIP